MKKIASLLMTVVLLAAMLSVFALPASAAEFTSGDYKYTVSDDGTATITKYTGNGGNIEIPADFDGHTVTVIGEGAFENCRSITTLTISDGVESIGAYAFYKCGQITNVTIPRSVDSIGKSAFSDCNSITTLTISGGVGSIGERAFCGCVQITSVTIPDSVKSIGESAFEGCWHITTLTISDGVESIGEFAFEGCGKIANVTIPNSVKSIGNDAFFGCGSNYDTGLVIHGKNDSVAEEYAIKHGVNFQGEGNTCKHLYRFTCMECNTSVTRGELFAAWGYNANIGSTLGEGSLTIICTAIAAAVFGLGGFLLGRKKKNPATANGADTDEE